MSPQQGVFVGLVAGGMASWIQEKFLCCAKPRPANPRPAKQAHFHATPLGRAMTSGNLDAEQHAELAKQHADMGTKSTAMDEALAELERLEKREAEDGPPTRSFPGKI